MEADDIDRTIKHEGPVIPRERLNQFRLEQLFARDAIPDEDINVLTKNKNLHRTSYFEANSSKFISSPQKPTEELKIEIMSH